MWLKTAHSNFAATPSMTTKVSDLLGDIDAPQPQTGQAFSMRCLCIACAPAVITVCNMRRVFWYHPFGHASNWQATQNMLDL